MYNINKPLHAGTGPVHPDSEQVLDMLAESSGVYPAAHVYVISSLMS